MCVKKNLNSPSKNNNQNFKRTTFKFHRIEKRYGEIKKVEL